MSFFAALLTFLFFCHPRLLATVAVIAAIVFLFTAIPLGELLMVLIVIGFLAHKAIMK